jgi:hypothetical protein
MTYSNKYAYLAGGMPFTGYTSAPIQRYDVPFPIAGSMSTELNTIDDQRLDEFLSSWKSPLSGDPLYSLIQNRTALPREQIREILFQLELRTSLGRELQRRTKDGALDVRSKLLNLEDPAMSADPITQKRRATLESRLDSLYRDEARVESDFWKDQQMLREKLIELLGQYREASTRERLIGELSPGSRDAR